MAAIPWAGPRAQLLPMPGCDLCGVYSSSAAGLDMEHQDGYLQTVFGFVGITDVTFVNAFSIDVPQRRAAAIEQGLTDARAAAWDAGWERFETIAA